MNEQLPFGYACVHFLITEDVEMRYKHQLRYSLRKLRTSLFVPHFEMICVLSEYTRTVSTKNNT